MEKFLTCEQVAERYHLKISTVWEWIKTGKLPAIRFGSGRGGGRYRVRLADLVEFEKQLETIKKVDVNDQNQ